MHLTTPVEARGRCRGSREPAQTRTNNSIADAHSDSERSSVTSESLRTRRESRNVKPSASAPADSAATISSGAATSRAAGTCRVARYNLSGLWVPTHM